RAVALATAACLVSWLIKRFCRPPMTAQAPSSPSKSIILVTEFGYFDACRRARPLMPHQLNSVRNRNRIWRVATESENRVSMIERRPAVCDGHGLAFLMERKGAPGHPD